MDKASLFRQFVAFTTSVHQVTHELTSDVRSDAITPVQYKILEYIAVSQPVTISQISDCIHMSMPNTSRELKKLIDKKLLVKLPDVGDRRKQYIRLSEQGEGMMGEIFDRIEVRFDQRLAGATEHERARIAEALQLLQEKMFY